MSRYIDADKMLKEYQETLCFNVLCSLCPFLDNIKDDTCQVEKWINAQPTADVVEVVRCKDCRYWQDNQEGHYPNELCPWDKNETPDEDDYCSFGERREDGTQD